MPLSLTRGQGGCSLFRVGIGLTFISLGETRMLSRRVKGREGEKIRATMTQEDPDRAPNNASPHTRILSRTDGAD